MRTIVFLAAAASLLAGACGGSDAPSNNASDNNGGAPVIKASGTRWEPAKVSTKVGETVTWKVEGGLVHDVHGDDGVEHAADDEFTYTHVYDEPGEYDFTCKVHPGMDGVVEVK